MYELHDPSQSQVSQLETKRLSQGRKVLKFLHSCFGGVRVIEKHFKKFQWENRFRVIQPIDLILGNTFQVFSSQETSSERAPCDQAVVVFGEKRLVIYLEIFPHQHVVLVLSSNRFVELVFFTDAQCLQNNLRFPVAGGPIESLTVLDDLAESSTNLFQRSIIVIHMSIEDVHIVHLQSGQRLLNAFFDVFPVSAAC